MVRAEIVISISIATAYYDWSDTFHSIWFAIMDLLLHCPSELYEIVLGITIALATKYKMMKIRDAKIFIVKWTEISISLSGCLSIYVYLMVHPYPWELNRTMPRLCFISNNLWSVQEMQNTIEKWNDMRTGINLRFIYLFLNSCRLSPILLHRHGQFVCSVLPSTQIVNWNKYIVQVDRESTSGRGGCCCGLSVL